MGTPTLIIRDGTNTPREITKLFIRDGSNTPREITSLFIRDTNNVSRLVYNPSGSATLAVVTDKDAVSGVSSGTGTATTDIVTASATGGTAPYTYAWLIDSPPPNPTVANAPANAATDFTMTGMSPDQAYTTSWTVTVTDDNSVTATASISANFADLTP